MYYHHSSTSWLPPFLLFLTLPDLLDLQTLPQPCNIKNKADSDSMELDDNNNNNNNNNKNNFNTK